MLYKRFITRVCKSGKWIALYIGITQIKHEGNITKNLRGYEKYLRKDYFQIMKIFEAILLLFSYQ